MALNHPDFSTGISFRKFPPVWVRGAGELGSAVALSLYRCGFRIFLSEQNPPLAIRRAVTFSDAIIEAQTSVETVLGRRYELDEFSLQDWPQDSIPLFPDNPQRLKSLDPLILVDARMIKHYDRDYRHWAKLVIGLGPGFIAGTNCHTVIETMRGHHLGRIIWKGTAQPNTGVPGNIGGESRRRVIHAPEGGKITWLISIGDLVNSGDTLGLINKKTNIRAPFNGLVRGLINPVVHVNKGLKIADVDPRGAGIDFHHVSDKSNAVGRSVLEAVLIFLKKV
ncbi:MAG: selenium-dependent molybdenum cofactor biosynthesis protein YqeB [Fidelibacterota bacterium]